MSFHERPQVSPSQYQHGGFVRIPGDLINAQS